MCRGAIMEGFLNIPGFLSVPGFYVGKHCKGPEYAGIWLDNVLWQGFEYAWSALHRVLNKPPVVNMPAVNM